MLHIVLGEKNPWTLVKQTNKQTPKSKFSVLENFVARVEVLGQPPVLFHLIIPHCLAPYQQARLASHWAQGVPDPCTSSRFSKCGFWRSSRAVCMSSRVLYWLNHLRPKSENNVKGSSQDINFKKSLTTNTKKNPTGLRMQ